MREAWSPANGMWRFCKQFKSAFQKFYLNHWCTVVGNPGGGGSLGVFGQILLRGVLGVVRKSVGGVSFLLHFDVEVFQNLYRVYMGCPPSPPCVHLLFKHCVILCVYRMSWWLGSLEDMEGMHGGMVLLVVKNYRTTVRSTIWLCRRGCPQTFWLAQRVPSYKSLRNINVTRGIGEVMWVAWSNLSTLRNSPTPPSLVLITVGAA